MQRQPIKLTRPEVRDVFVNARLMAQLDADLQRGAAVWIAAPPGSGKTTLLSSYVEARGRLCLWYQLDRGDRDLASLFANLASAARSLATASKQPLPHLGTEYATDLEAFARNFFTAWYRALPRRTLIVLDDAHCLNLIDAQAALLDALTATRDPQIDLVFLGRQVPPPGLAKLSVRRSLATYGWSEMRLPADEARQLLAHVATSVLSAAQVERINHIADGWAAGLVLLAAHAEHLPAAPGHSMDQAPQVVVDYCTAELFDHLDHEVQDFLVDTSLLPQMTAAMAQAWSGQRRAGPILDRLYREQLLVLRYARRPPVFQVHPLLRACLRFRLQQRLSAATFARRCQQAARLLEEQGALDAAGELLEEVGEMSALAALVLRHAESLIRDGQFETVARWTRSLPAAELEREPWLAYWAGVSILPSDTVGARRHLVAAHERFVAQRARTGAYLSWARIVESIILESGGYKQLDRWLDVHDELKRTLGTALSVEAYARVNVNRFNALLYRRSDALALRRIESTLRRLLRVAPDLNARFLLGASLVRYYGWTGDLAAMQSVMKRLQSQVDSPNLTPFTRVVWTALTSSCGWLVEYADAGLQAADQGLQLAQQTGIHLLDFYLLVQGAYSALALDRIDLAQQYIDRMPGTFKPERSVDMGQWIFVRGWLQLARNEHAAALASLREAMEVARSTGSPYVIARAHHGLSQAQACLGDHSAALASLDTASDICGPHNFVPLRYLIDLCRAESWFALGDDVRGRAALARALKLGRERGYHYIPHWTRRQLVALCSRALADGIETGYVREVIAKQRLSAPAESDPSAAHWPWPVRVHTLGPFAVTVDGVPLQFERKSQARPLALLKLIIAHGGHRVPAHRVAEELWPDSDADDAHDALKTTLVRLRRLIGGASIVHAEGVLTLAPDQVWVDALALERGLQALLEDSVAVADGCAGWLALYRGPFLRDEEAAWAIAPRERLCERYLRALERTARALQENNQVAAAIALYERGLEVEEQSEALYLGLMRCQVADGRANDALAAYARCERMLQRTTGAAPARGLLELRDRCIG